MKLLNNLKISPPPPPWLILAKAHTHSHTFVKAHFPACSFHICFCVLSFFLLQAWKIFCLSFLSFRLFSNSQSAFFRTHTHMACVYALHSVYTFRRIWFVGLEVLLFLLFLVSFFPSLSHNHSTTALYCLAVANCPFLSLFPSLSQTLHHTFLLFSLFDGVCVFCLASVSERVCLCECGISFVITTLSNKNINIR